MTRFPDWEYQLGCLLEQVKDRPRVLSYPIIKDRDWDCGRWICEAILHMTGRPVHVWADCYQSWRQLTRLMGNNEAFEDYIAQQMTKAGIPEIPVEESRKGDVLIVETPAGKRGLAVRLGENCTAPGKKGLEYTSVETAIRAFKVG